MSEPRCPHPQLVQPERGVPRCATCREHVVVLTFGQMTAMETAMERLADENRWLKDQHVILTRAVTP